MSDLQSQLPVEEILDHAVLDDVHRFWFRHIEDEERLVVPSQQDPLVWFSQNDDFDHECSAKFGSLLQQLVCKKVTVDDLLVAARPSKALDWMNLIILLDQIPRNCYRGERAGVAYQFFDPLALDVAYRAIAADLPDHPSVRWKQTYRFWFYLPLEHSESLDVLHEVIAAHKKMFGDGHSLMRNPPLGGESEALRCREVLLRRQAEFETWEKTLQGMLQNHIATAEKYGRYPHRDEALGRTAVDLE